MPPFGVVLGKEVLEQRGDWHLARAFLYPCALADSSLDLQCGQVRKRRRRAWESPCPGAPPVPRSWRVAERSVSWLRRRREKRKLARGGTGPRTASW